jgi:hypothetical protein
MPEERPGRDSNHEGPRAARALREAVRRAEEALRQSQQQVVPSPKSWRLGLGKPVQECSLRTGTDFGLVLPLGVAAEGEKLTQDGAVTGTPAYMSPEQAGGQEELGPASDIYSVGALAYFLLTGRPPFAGRSAVKALAAHLYEEPEPVSARRPGVPADLEAAVLRCLAKNPADRFEDVERLESAAAGRST